MPLLVVISPFSFRISRLLRTVFRLTENRLTRAFSLASAAPFPRDPDRISASSTLAIFTDFGAPIKSLLVSSCTNLFIHVPYLPISNWSTFAAQPRNVIAKRHINRAVQKVIKNGVFEYSGKPSGQRRKLAFYPFQRRVKLVRFEARGTEVHRTSEAHLRLAQQLRCLRRWLCQGAHLLRDGMFAQKRNFDQGLPRLPVVFSGLCKGSLCGGQEWDDMFRWCIRGVFQQRRSKRASGHGGVLRHLMLAVELLRTAELVDGMLSACRVIPDCCLSLDHRRHTKPCAGHVNDIAKLAKKPRGAVKRLKGAVERLIKLSTF